LGSSVFLALVLGDAGAMGSVLIGNADQLKDLSYSRSLEKEADLEGLKLLADRKIDGNGFVGLFEILKKEPAVEMSEWINSHPNLDKRIKYIKEDESFNRNGVEKNETLNTLFLKIKTAE
jgi:beta-barrel assembly-enhancing protease